MIEEIKKILLRFLEMILCITAGYLLYTFILKRIYINFGIEMTGNIWINWVGASFIFFSIYTFILSFFPLQTTINFKNRLQSAFFWLFFVAAIYIILAPFFLGHNPF